MAALTVYLLAGMTGTFKVPINKVKGEGYFPKTGSVTINNEAKTLTRGFVAENSTVGTIEKSDNTAVEIIYKHKKSLTNTIYFFAATGEITTIYIGSVPIHDHSSVVQGGPAYGTYFSDDEEIS